MNDWTLLSCKSPSRQGFYRVLLVDEDLDSAEGRIAEWREYNKKEGKRWWQHVATEPSEPKRPQLLDNVMAFDKVGQAEVDAALRRELTLQEKLDQAYAHYVQHASLYPAYAQTPPPSRQLLPGELVELGRLTDVRVVETRDEGRVVIVSLRDIRREGRNTVDHGIAYRGVHWLDLVSKQHLRSDRLAQETLMYGGYTSAHLWSLLKEVVCGLEFTADYQREYVWTEEDQQRYLDALMSGRDVGRFLFVKRKYPLADQVLDGKQRLSTLMLFWRSEIAWRGVYWHELSPADRSRIEDRCVQVARLDEDRYQRSGLLRIFLEVNAAGVPQTEEHLNYVRALLAAEEAREALMAS